MHFFSGAYGTLSRTDHMVGHKRNLNKRKRIEIIQHTFYKHYGMNFKNQ